MIKQNSTLSLYACSSQPCENTFADIRSLAKDDNSADSLIYAAKRLALLNFLENDKTLQVTGAA